MSKGGGNKKRFNIVLTRQDNKFFISELFKVIQDAISLIQRYRTMCLIRTSTFFILDVQSVYLTITNSDLIPGGKVQAGKEHIFWTVVNPMDKEHKDPYKLDLTKPRLAWYKQQC